MAPDALEHQLLYDRVVIAIDALFGDRSVPTSQTLEDLNELAGELRVRIDALEVDIDRAGRYDDDEEE